MMTLGFLPSIGPAEFALILLLVLIVFGAGKLPGAGKAIGQSIKEFKSAIRDSDINTDEKKEA